MNKQSLHIIGGSGQMGKWLREFLEKENINVSVSGREYKQNKELKTATIVFISVPISKASEVIQKVSTLVTKDCLIVDLSSIKSPIIEVLQILPQPSLALHMLFGPSILSLRDHVIIAIETQKSDKSKIVIDLFRKHGADIIHMSPEEHDMTMAHIQGLIHFTNMSLAHVLQKENIDMTGHLATPVFKSQLATLYRVLWQDPGLLAEIQLTNPFTHKVLTEYIEYQTKLLEMIGSGKKQTLENEYRHIQQKVKTGEENQRVPIPKMGKSSDIKVSDTIAYLGPAATYSHEIAKKISKNGNTLLIPCTNLYDVFRTVQSGKATLGIAASENSTEGTVRETLDYLIEFGLYVNGTIDLPIHHCLLSKEKNLMKIQTIYAHPQALAQCKEWIRVNIPNAKIEATASNLSAIAETNKPGIALIGSKHAAKLYDLSILAEDISDNEQNVTRFYIISKDLYSLQKTSNKTLLYFTVLNRTGILKDILTLFADLSIGLSRIESRPSKVKMWDYCFFIEVEASLSDESLQQALHIMKQYCEDIKVLGML